MSELKGKTDPLISTEGTDLSGVARRAAVCGGVGFVVGLLLQGLLSSHLSPEGATGVWLGMLPLQIGAFGAAGLSLLADSGVKQVSSLAGLGPGFRASLRPALTGLVWVFPAVTLLGSLLRTVWEAAGCPLTEGLLVKVLVETGGAPVWFTVAVSAVIVAPLSEEVLFRRVLHDVCADFGLPLPALWTAVVFACAHGQPEQFPGLVLLGVALQSLRTRTHSLWASVLLHACFNATALVLMLILFLLGEPLT